MADNIFDDVDAILGDELTDEDNNFNESELQDIMSEIEDLEKEFEAEITPEMSLQEKIDAELTMEKSARPQEELAPVVESTITPKPETLLFNKPQKTTAASSEVAFKAIGSMSLNLDFKVGSETAKLCIDPVKGLTVTVSGVELWINEDEGCIVSMENGMKFTIPLSTLEKSHKKAA